MNAGDAPPVKTLMSRTSPRLCPLGTMLEGAMGVDSGRAAEMLVRLIGDGALTARVRS